MNLLIEGIEKGLVLKTQKTVEMVFDGIRDSYSVYKIKLEALFYNDQNDRIATRISQYEHEHNIENLSRENIEEYNDIIQQFIIDSNPERLKETKANIALLGQLEYGIVLVDGRIIDGNRRYTCLRMLASENDKFGYFEAIILDKNYNNYAKAIKKLELQVQIGKDRPVEYDPIDRLVGMYRDIVSNKLLTEEEYKKSTGMKDSVLKNDLEVAKLMVEYLATIGMPNQYFIARELKLDGPLREIKKALDKIEDINKKTLFKYICFANLTVSPEGDLTRFMRKFTEIAKSNYLDTFIKQEENTAEEFFENLTSSEVTLDKINIIQMDNTLKEKYSNTMEQNIQRIRKGNAKNKPIDILNKLFDKVNDIDVDLIKTYMIPRPHHSE